MPRSRRLETIGTNSGMCGHLGISNAAPLRPLAAGHERSEQAASIIVRFAMSPKRGWRDFFAQIELGLEIANIGVK